MGISVFPAPSGGLSEKTIQYTTPGLSTFTLPTGYGVGNPLLAEVTIVAGGGSAGGGFYSSATSFGIGGGGGGGGIFKRQLSLTANMNVYVGRGGACYGSDTMNGGNGEFSYIGTGTPKNLFINPQFLGISGVNAMSIQVEPAFSNSSGSASFASAIRGACIRPEQWNNRSFWDGQTYPVKPSTQYTFSIHYRDAGGTASQARLDLRWFTENGTSITSDNGSTFTGVSGSWNRAHVGATSPSTAAYCTLRISRISGDNGMTFSNAQFEEGVTSPTTYVDGDSTGYIWGGNKAGSVTLLASETINIANGGGGGGGSGYLNGQGNSGSSAFAGGCSGGAGARAVDTSNDGYFIVSGDGGGLGGNATQRILTFPLGTTNVNTLGPLMQNYHRYADFGFGTRSFIVLPGSINYARGAGGRANSDGYGQGGTGSTVVSGSSNFQELQFAEANNSTWVNNTRKLVDGRPNSGNGGSHLTISTSPTGGSAVGIQGLSGNGGSGLVIIKYWS